MTKPPTNLQVLKPTRKKPQRGDIFVMQVPDDTYLFGRVIDADIMDPQRAPMPGSYLIYVYDTKSQSRRPDLADLTPDGLLLPPVFINKMPWTRGYFETVENATLGPADLLPRVSYWDAARARFVDQDGNALPREVQPCGDWALSSYRWLDDQISDALGIPRVPEDV
jgi:Immunity protein 26